MGCLKRFFDDYFDDRSQEINENGGYDPDEYDEANNPSNPIWDGSDIHYNQYGTDPTLPDPNDVNQD